MKQTPATRRLSEQLREKLGYILLYEIADPRLDLVTITGVEVAQDRSYARIFVRSLLARALDWRIVPELDFRIDRSTDEAMRIAAALENVPPTIGVAKDEEGYPVQGEGAAEDEPAGDASSDTGELDG